MAGIERRKKADTLERMLKTARDCFLQNPYEQVSIRTIANESHCSMATIYDVYENKEKLFEAAIRLHEETWDAPCIVRCPGPISLKPLMDYAYARIHFLSHSLSRKSLRAIASRPDNIAPLRESTFAKQRHFADVKAEIAACIDASLLRSLPAEVIAYNIISAVSFEPVVFGIIYGHSAPVDGRRLIGNIFLPLVTQEGAEQLTRYTDAIQQEDGVEYPPFI